MSATNRIEEATERTINLIEKDFTDRRGLRQEWEQIDDDIKEEIRTTWKDIIREEIIKIENGN